MKYYVEDSLSNFKFWSGAKDRADLLTADELDQVDDQLEELLGSEYSDTAVNDLFWFDFESVCACIGLKLNSHGNPIRSIEDVDMGDVVDAVQDWCDDNCYAELDGDQVHELAVALRDGDGLSLEGEDVVVDDDCAEDCAKGLGYHQDGEDADEDDEEDDEEDGDDK